MPKNECLKIIKYTKKYILWKVFIYLDKMWKPYPGARHLSVKETNNPKSRLTIYITKNLNKKKQEKTGHWLNEGVGWEEYTGKWSSE